MARIPWDLVLIGGFGYVAWKKGWIDQLLAGSIGTTPADPSRQRGTGPGTVKPPGPAFPLPSSGGSGSRGGTPGSGGVGSGKIIVHPPGSASSAAGATERSIGAADGTQFGLLRVTR